MAKKVKLIALISALLTLLSAIIYMCTGSDAVFTLLITCGTTAYHFLMRLAVGGIINRIFHNRMNYSASWFAQRPFEKKLYKALRVKKWKGKMGTYDPSLFDSSIHTMDEIAGAMCQAEIVHEIIILLSFVPILGAIPFGTLGVFVITSLLAACFDSMFVIMQRYNRPRVLKLMKRNEQTLLKK